MTPSQIEYEKNHPWTTQKTSEKTDLNNSHISDNFEKIIVKEFIHDHDTVHQKVPVLVPVPVFVPVPAKPDTTPYTKYEVTPYLLEAGGIVLKTMANGNDYITGQFNGITGKFETAQAGRQGTVMSLLSGFIEEDVFSGPSKEVNVKDDRRGFEGTIYNAHATKSGQAFSGLHIGGEIGPVVRWGHVTNHTGVVGGLYGVGQIHTSVDSTHYPPGPPPYTQSDAQMHERQQWAGFAGLRTAFLYSFNKPTVTKNEKNHTIVTKQKGPYIKLELGIDENFRRPSNVSPLPLTPNDPQHPGYDEHKYNATGRLVLGWAF